MGERGRPGFTAIEGHHGPAVVGDDHPIGVLWIKCNVMEIILGPAALIPCLSAVQRLPQLVAGHPQLVAIRGAGVDMHIVERSLDNAGMIGKECPGRPSVFRLIQPRLCLRVDQG